MSAANREEIHLLTLFPDLLKKTPVRLLTSILQNDQPYESEDQGIAEMAAKITETEKELSLVPNR